VARIATSRGNASGSEGAFRCWRVERPSFSTPQSSPVKTSPNGASIARQRAAVLSLARTWSAGLKEAGHPHQCGQSRRYRHAWLPAGRSGRDPVGRLFRPDRQHRPHWAEWSSLQCRKGGHLSRLRRQPLYHRKRNLRRRRDCPDLTSPIEHPSSARRARTALCSSGPARGSVLRTATPPRRSF
jgi:hypothetical protein